MSIECCVGDFVVIQFDLLFLAIGQPSEYCQGRITRQRQGEGMQLPYSLHRGRFTVRASQYLIIMVRCGQLVVTSLHAGAIFSNRPLCAGCMGGCMPLAGSYTLALVLYIGTLPPFIACIIYMMRLGRKQKLMTLFAIDDACART